MPVYLDEGERAALVAAGVELGHTTQEMNDAVDLLLAAAGELASDRTASETAALQAKIAALTTFRNRVLMGRAFVNNNMPAGAAKDATLAALDNDIARTQKLILRLQQELANL